ncbi:hypothetical protein POK33_38065 [Burkholderia cenocepacia]|uniref:hypothetical protein n=1 Tax=Burkholderia cenocepacia TaxID=95486 RepID=UPI0023B8FC6F|nr:hypothetical protein [Burkholderia cenocepacia]MDF0506561.1 hypothetical protein [Burkholderia cenocepacia]
MLIVTGGTLAARVAALALQCGVGVIVAARPHERLRGGARSVESGLRQFVASMPDFISAPAEPEPDRRRSEAADLRREHRWREKQARSMINARIKAQRRGAR